MIELLRDSVQTWECDQMGHLNVQFYVERAEAGAAALESSLRRAEARREVELRLLELHIRFHREVRPGAALVLRGGFLEAQTRCGDLALCLELVRLTAEEPVLAASFTLDLTVHRSGEPVEVPSAWRELVASSLCELPATSALRGLDAHQARGQASLAAADELGLLPIQRGPVAERECGAQGLSAA
ncbi:MAG: thioesterase family protein, partial [Acidobacteriota bacterium]